MRVASPLSHRLVEAMSAYAIALGAVAVHIARILAKSGAYEVSAPSLLAWSEHKVAARRQIEIMFPATPGDRHPGDHGRRTCAGRAATTTASVCAGRAATTTASVCAGRAAPMGSGTASSEHRRPGELCGRGGEGAIRR